MILTYSGGAAVFDTDGLSKGGGLRILLIISKMKLNKTKQKINAELIIRIKLKQNVLTFIGEAHHTERRASNDQLLHYDREAVDVAGLRADRDHDLISNCCLSQMLRRSP